MTWSHFVPMSHIIVMVPNFGNLLKNIEIKESTVRNGLTYIPNFQPQCMPPENI